MKKLLLLYKFLLVLFLFVLPISIAIIYLIFFDNKTYVLILGAILSGICGIIASIFRRLIRRIN